MADDLGVIFKDRADARIEAQPIAPGEPPGAEDPQKYIKLYRNPTAEQLAMPATYREVVYAANKIMKLVSENFAEELGEALSELVTDRINERLGPLKAKPAELGLETARQRAVIAELKAQVSELSFVSERLRIDRRGPPGLRGERGRDGPPGKGERGAQGERGAPAPALAAWEPHPERFTITPVYSTGERGPPINLLSLFEAYHGAAGELEDADLEEAAAASRRAVEREVEASRWVR